MDCSEISEEVWQEAAGKLSSHMRSCLAKDWVPVIFWALLQVWDLSQVSESYMRTDLVDGSLMTLKRNTSAYSKKKRRCLAAEEIFSALAIPTTEKFEACFLSDDE